MLLNKFTILCQLYSLVLTKKKKKKLYSLVQFICFFCIMDSICLTLASKISLPMKSYCFDAYYVPF